MNCDACRTAYSPPVARKSRYAASTRGRGPRAERGGGMSQYPGGQQDPYGSWGGQGQSSGEPGQYGPGGGYGPPGQYGPRGPYGGQLGQYGPTAQPPGGPYQQPGRARGSNRMRPIL